MYILMTAGIAIPAEDVCLRSKNGEKQKLKKRAGEQKRNKGGLTAAGNITTAITTHHNLQHHRHDTFHGRTSRTRARRRRYYFGLRKQISMFHMISLSRF